MAVQSRQSRPQASPLMKLLRGMDQEALTALVAARPDVAAQPEPRSLRPSPVVSPVAPGATRAVATTG